MAGDDIYNTSGTSDDGLTTYTGKITFAPVGDGWMLDDCKDCLLYTAPPRSSVAVRPCSCRLSRCRLATSLSCAAVSPCRLTARLPRAAPIWTKAPSQVRVCPVSYTHLDVYKRQRRRRSETAMLRRSCSWMRKIRSSAPPPMRSMVCSRIWRNEKGEPGRVLLFHWCRAED